MKTDLQLQKDVMDELKRDPMIAASEIGVAVKNGVVTLSGYVDSCLKRSAAERAAKRVKEVIAVAEDIALRLDSTVYRDDTAIAEAALSVFKWNNNVPEDLITLKVDEGRITLEGTVDWQYQKNAAENAVKYIAGVKGIQNNIRVKLGVETAVVERNIRQALKRNADLNADHIKVQAFGSKVILSGKTSSWSNRQEAERAAWSSPGVTDVEDKLVICPLTYSGQHVNEFRKD